MAYLDPVAGSRRQPVAAAAIPNLTDNSGGAADGILQAVSATPLQAEIRNNDADLAAKVNAILAALRSAGVIST